MCYLCYSEQQPIQPATVVVIQPGSYNLRIGRASDAYPVTVPHCIARKVKSSPFQEQSLEWIVREECSVRFCRIL